VPVDPNESAVKLAVRGEIATRSAATLPPVGEIVPHEFRRDLLQMRFMPLAIEHTLRSLDTAKELHAAGFLSPAFVWAVRSGEIFFREALLFPIEFEATGDITASFAKVRHLFQGGRWAQAIKRVRTAYGLEGAEHDALIENGEAAWLYWSRHGVGPRGETVHGRCEIEDDETVEWAIAFVDRMREWFTLRVIMSEQGPFAGTLRELFERASEEYRREQSHGVDNFNERQEFDDAG
jgi:hypothetical protein